MKQWKNISIFTFFLLIYYHYPRVKLLLDENNTATDQHSIGILNKMEEVKGERKGHVM